jgi:hypothetical protein
VVVVLGIGIIGVAAWRITAGAGREKVPAVMARRVGSDNEGQTVVQSEGQEEAR